MIKKCQIRLSCPPNQFGFGNSQLTAVGHYNDNKHPHVLHLTLLRNPFTRAAIWLLSRLPLAFQNLVRPICPHWFLPKSLVLKKLKPTREDLFDNEKRMYKRLHDLQGSMIPYFYGEGVCEGARALILSEVNGIHPSHQIDPLPLEDFQDQVKLPLEALRDRGVVYDDVGLENLFIVGDKIMLVDLESVWEPGPDDMVYFFDSYLANFTALYKEYICGLSMDF